MIQLPSLLDFYVYGFPVFGFSALLYPVYKVYVEYTLLPRIRKFIMENYYT